MAQFANIVGWIYMVFVTCWVLLAGGHAQGICAVPVELWVPTIVVAVLTFGTYEEVWS